MQLQAQPVTLAVRIFLDDLEPLHGIQQAMSGRLIDAQGRGDLRDAHFRAVLAEMNENAQRLLQRFARSGRPRTTAQGLSFP